MLIRYGDECWERLADDPCHQPSSWGDDLVRSYRKRHQVLAAAECREDLAALRSLDLRPETTPSGLGASVRLLDGARLLLEFDEKKPDLVTVAGIVRPETQEVAR
ncbi:hypothetical protein [Lentzea sp. CA-135723]|uniref:hypothetical protein n=1 Tax=Lentzea sp. CA-135723 TaxID=3239950 RepID=UPI003D905B61